MAEGRQIYVPTPGEMALSALAEATGEEDPAIQQILRSVLPAVDASELTADFSDAGDPVPAQLAAAATGRQARPRRDGTRDPDVIDVSDEADDDGRLTLRQVMATMVSASKRTATKASAAAKNDEEPEDDGADDIDLTSRILDSRILGEAVEHVIEVNAIDNSFSVFGAGRFEFQFGDNHDLLITDMTSNVSMGLNARDDEMLERRHAPNGKIDLWAVFLGFLQSPSGMLAAVGACTALLVGSVMRLALRLRRS